MAAGGSEVLEGVGGRKFLANQLGEWIHTGSEPARLLCPRCESDDIHWQMRRWEWRVPELRGSVLMICGAGDYYDDDGEGDRLECKGCLYTTEIPDAEGLGKLGIELDYE